MRWIEVSTQAQLEALKPGEGAIVRSGHFTAYGSSTVRAYGSSTVRAYGSSTVWACGSSTVWACGSSTVTACGSSTVTAYGSSTVRAYGSSTVRAYGSSTVWACDSSTVTAGASTAVHLLSDQASVKGGVVIRPKRDTPADWCGLYGIDVTKAGYAVLFKAVEDDWMGSHKRGITYRPGDKPEAPDWNSRAECGGGLHLSPFPFMARRYCDNASHFVAVKVKATDLVVIDDKVKVRTCTVLYEVDEDGNKL